MANQKQGACGRVDIGGQAVLEGVMMKAPDAIAISVRRPDGTIEALEAPEKRFYLAIQSHPEDICDDNQAMDKLFQAFLQAAREYRESQQAVEQSSTEDSASGSRQSPTEVA